MTRGERVCAFIEKHCRVPEGDLVGKPIRLAEFQSAFIKEVYDNPAGTTKAILSTARKNAKTATIAAIALANIDGPEAFPNSQIVSGARSRDQAAQVYNYASKMALMSETLRNRIRPVPSSKRLVGLAAGAEYRALSADAKTNHGLSPRLAILDELGQVRGPHDDFVEAVVTSQLAYDDAMLLAISTQAASDDDLFSRWLDDAATGADPHTVCHLYSAPQDCDLDDEAAWRAANPALGLFCSREQLAHAARRALVQRAEENSFRWLHLNQRVSAESPFVSKSEWLACAGEPPPMTGRVFGGLDLSASGDMTALVFVGGSGDAVGVQPHFWLPAKGLEERSKADRTHYDIWAEREFMHASPGPSIDYRHIAEVIMEARETYDLASIAYDPNMFAALTPHLEDLGLNEKEREELFYKVPQNYASMTPCIDALRRLIAEERLQHGGHPVLTWNATNTVLLRGRVTDQMLLAKRKGANTQRIDGMVALAMACGRRDMMIEDAPQSSIYEERGVLVL